MGDSKCAAGRSFSVHDTCLTRGSRVGDRDRRAESESGNSASVPDCDWTFRSASIWRSGAGASTAVRAGNTGQRPSKHGGVEHSLGKRLRGFLRQIVPDAALDESGAHICPRTSWRRNWGPGCGAPLASPSSVMVGHGDDRTCGKPLFQIVIFRLAFSQAEPPAIIVDHDGDMIRVVEGRRACDRTWRRRSSTSAKRSAK